MCVCAHVFMWLQKFVLKPYTLLSKQTDWPDFRAR